MSDSRDEIFKAKPKNLAAIMQLGLDPLPTSPDAPTEDPLSAPMREQVGDRIGRYKLIAQIGKGGCGVVYMAEQTEPIHRQVALKVIKLGMDTEQVIARFEAERQALALMDHPNIAKVLDAGATETGRPFFVMELVRGDWITDYCDKNHLSAQERLKLFIQVCQAIQHAHQKGIIHRDIKPSNILVSLHEGVAVPRVIDFGIAKATTGQELTDKTIFTTFEQFIGTPAYMSPEQAAGSGQDVDARSDIYSLGVLLYELLTGERPLAKELQMGGLDEMRRTIREKQPVRPSTRLRHLAAEELSRVAERRGCECPRLIRLVHGDLDWIVMKALEKDRTRRYQTANGLANDIQRHLNGETVLARPPSKIYQLERMVRRNKLAFAAASAVAASLVTGLGVSTWMYFKVKTNLSTSDFLQAVHLIQAGERSEAGAYLAGSLSANPKNGAALTRLTTLLTYHSWMLPAVILEHKDEVQTARFSPDGRWIVTASSDNTARVWDTETGQALSKPLAHTGGVRSAEFSPDGKRIVTASADRTVVVWDAQTGQPRTGPMAHGEAVWYAEFSPDGKHVVTASADYTARVWDGQTGQALTEPLKHKGEVRYAKFSPDGKWVVTASYDHTARVWDAQTGKPRTPPLEHRRAVRCAQFNRDGKWVVTASFDHTAQVWNAQSGQPVAKTSKDDGEILSAEFSPDGKWFVTGSMGGTARVWNATNGEALTGPLKHSGQVVSARFSADGKWIVTASWDRTARVWDAQSGEPLTQPFKHGRRVFSAELSPDGRRLLTASGDSTSQVWDALSGPALPVMFRASAVISPPNVTLDSETIAQFWDKDARRWDVQRRKDLAVLKDTEGVSSAQVSPDGKRIVTAHWNNTVRVWDAGSGQPLGAHIRHGDVVNSAVFSRDGARIVTASADGTARIWNSGTGEALTGALKHGSNVLSAQFSPDGNWIVTASQDSTARIWDAHNGQPLASLGHEDSVISAEFSPDGKRVVTASWDKTARVWDARTGNPLGKPVRHANRVQSARFSPDGGRVVTTCWDCSARVWDGTSGEPRTEPMRHDDAIVTAEFSPDGKRIVTASVDNAAMVWNAETGRALTRPLRERSSILSAHFSSDGNRIVTACDNGIARVWDVRSGQPLSDDFEQGGYLFSAQFSPDGERVLTASFERAPKVWDVAPSSANYPDWLLLLAEAISGQKLNDQNLLQDTKHKSAETISQIRRRLEEKPADSDWAVWGRWFLADPATRTIAPFSKVTVPEYIEDRIKENTTESLEEAERLAFGKAELLERILQAEKRLGQRKTP